MTTTDRLAHAAVEHVESGMTVGLGTGRAASRGIRALAALARDRRLDIRCAPTSESSALLASDLGLTLVPLDEVDSIDVLFDGVDEFDSRLRMLKGGGGAMTREKIAASIASRRIYLVQDHKRVASLGERMPLPVEVIDPGRAAAKRSLAALGLHGAWRRDASGLVRTDQGNAILDVALADAALDLGELDAAIERIPGVVEHGLFLDQADVLHIEDERGELATLTRPG